MAKPWEGERLHSLRMKLGRSASATAVAHLDLNA
jgi:hypothetical protein